jgi:hypothetical protein
MEDHPHPLVVHQGREDVRSQPLLVDILSKVTIPDPTGRIILQARALVRAIEALATIQPSGPFERAPARVLMAAYKQRLRGIVAAAPAWASEEMLSTSERGKAAPLFDFYPEPQYTMCV